MANAIVSLLSTIKATMSIMILLLSAQPPVAVRFHPVMVLFPSPPPSHSLIYRHKGKKRGEELAPCLANT